MKSLFREIISRQALLLTFICIAAYLPFINKAFNIDSNVTVYVAEQMKQNPLNPALGEYGKLLAKWNNYPAMPENSIFFATPHPPLVPLYLMPFIAFFGEREWVLNTAMLPFYPAAVLFFWGISGLILRRWRFETSLLFALCPAVLVNAQNIMLDVPLTAFILGAFYFMFRSEKPESAFYAGCFTAAACLTKVTGATAAIAGIMFYLLSKKRMNLFCFLLPVVAVNGLWALHNLAVLGKIQLFAAGGEAKILIGDVRYRIERMASLLGATVAFPVVPALLGLYIRKLRRPTLLLLAVSGLWAGALMLHLGYSFQHAIIYAISAASGGVMLYTVALKLSFRTSLPVAASLLSHAVMQLAAGLFVGTMAARYLLPMLFVATLSVPLLIDMTPLSDSSMRRLWMIIIGSTLLSSAGLAVSDYLYVDAERRVAVDIRRSFPKDNIWYMGRLGYLYYMHRIGGSFFGARSVKAQTGDIFVINTYNNDDKAMLNCGGEFKELKSFSYPLPMIRTMGKGAGFYGCDRIPYSIVTRPRRREFIVLRKER